MNCELCDGKGWVIVDIEGDSYFDWVQACGDCNSTVSDSEALIVAARDTGRQVGRAHARVGDVEEFNTRPYLRKKR